MSSELFKLIIMDDDSSVHKILNQYLTKRNVYVKSLYNPEDLDEIHLEDYDAILLDYYFKGNKKNGLDLLKQIRNINFYICIILMTGYSSENLAIEAIRYNIDDFLVKPVNYKKIPDIIIQNIVKNRSNKLNKSRYISNSKKETKFFTDIIILKNSIPILSLGSWNEHQKKIDNNDVLIGGFLSAIHNFSNVYFGQSLNELSLNKEKLLFYKESDFVICLRVSNDRYSEIDSIISKKSILEQMKKIIEYLSIYNDLDENNKIPLNIKTQVNKLIKASNRRITKEIYQNVFTKEENKGFGNEKKSNKSNVVL